MAASALPNFAMSSVSIALALFGRTLDGNVGGRVAVIRAENPVALGEIHRFFDENDDVGAIALPGRGGDDPIDVGRRDVAD